MASLQDILANRPILAPYNGPTVAELNRAAVKLIAHSQDFSSLVEDWDGWEEGEVGPVSEFVRGQLNIKPGLSEYSEQVRKRLQLKLGAALLAHML